MRGRAASGGNGYILRRAGRDDMPAFVSGTGSNIDNPVARRDYAHVVFYDEHRIAGFDQALKLRSQLFDIRRMQAGRRLIEDIKSSATLGTLQFGRELDALGLASGKLRRRLPKPDVAQADFPDDL